MPHKRSYSKYLMSLFGCMMLCFSLATFSQVENYEGSVELDSNVNKPSEVTFKLEELSNFIDGYAESMVNDFEPPGMIVSVVVGDQKITKGYGIADMETGRKNDQTTLFRIGSISKLFVWLSAHMLADEGKLDLDADINTYLDNLSTHGEFDGPITMRDLMAHRQGFDDNVLDFMHPNRNISLEDAISRVVPLRVASSGERTSYSNTGTNIAALIVERISGQSYYDFVEERILNPVGLNSVTLRDPETGNNDKALDARMAKAHEMKDGIAVNANYLPVRPQEPVGAVAMDAENAAIFMRMLLDKTQYDGGRLMSEEAWTRITKPAFDDAIGGDDMGWGFMLNDVDGLATVGHGGATKFLSWMFVIPEIDAGVFISVNLRSRETRTEQFAWSIVRRIVGTDSMSNFMQLEGNPEAAKQIAGDYLNNRRPQDRGVNFSGMGGDVNVKATEDGFLVFPGEKPTRYAPISADIWVSKAGNRIRIVRGENGEVKRIHLGFGSTTFERIGFIDSKKALAVGFGGVLLFSITGLMGIYYRHGREMQLNQAGKTLGWVNVSSIIIWSLFFISIIAVLNAMANLDLSEIDNAPFPPLSVKLFFIIIFLVCIQTVIHVGSLLSIWKSSGWTLLRKINFTIYGVFALYSVYLLHHWKLIGGSVYGL